MSGHSIGHSPASIRVGPRWYGTCPMHTIMRLLALALLASACASPTATDCERAVEAVELCTGASVAEAPYSATCDASEAAHAREIVAELDRSGCEGEAPAVAGKADNPLCLGGRWDPLRVCENPPALGEAPAGDAARYPIVLAHGFNTTTENFWRFHDDIVEALREDGHEVVAGDVPAFNTPQVRAEALAVQVDALIAEGHERVSLVCFSMGGIDCRYLVSPDGLGYGDRVASVTTISAPHQGTAVADMVIDALEAGDRIGAGDAGRWLLELFGVQASRLYGQDGVDVALVDALASMSERGMVTFNREIGDDPRVEYQSWASASYVGGLALPGWRARLEEACEGRVLTHDFERDVMFAGFVPTAAIVAHGGERRPHDGVSTVEGARWGTFRGCVPADHLDVVGQVNDHRPNRRTGWDYVRFYRNLAFDLAARGY